MTNEVLVSISGLQMAPDEQTDSVEVIAPGEYYYRNNKHFVIYDEVAEGESEATNNIFKFNGDMMEVTRKGPANVHLVFEKNKKNVTYYYTPFGSLNVGIEARSIEVTEEENEIKVNVKYALEVNYEHVAECDIVLTVKSKGSEFKLL